MDWAFEKFSLYDFFNLLFSGGSLLLGLQLIGLSPIDYLSDSTGLMGDGISFLLVILLSCFVLGYMLQGLGSLLDQTVSPLQRKMTGSCLMEGSGVIGNPEKLRIYRLKAFELLSRKAIKIRDGRITESQSRYFFGYCSYVVQLDPRCRKVEKMRALNGLASQWRVCFGLLACLGLIRHALPTEASASGSATIWLPVVSTLFAGLAVLSHFRMRENLLFWIRMVLAMYEVLDDERIRSNVAGERNEYVSADLNIGKLSDKSSKRIGVEKRRQCAEASGSEK